MAHDVLRSLVDEVREAEYYAVSTDEAAGGSAKEQLSVYFRAVAETFYVQELFCGFFSTAHSIATSLFAILKDILCQ